MRRGAWRRLLAGMSKPIPSFPLPVKTLPHHEGLELPAYQTPLSAGMDLVAALPDGEPVSLDAFVRRAGNSYARPRSPVGALLVEAIVASRRHGEIAEMIRGWLLEGEGAMGAAIDQAQGEGLVTADVGATELARFSTMVALGARLAGVLDLPPVDEARWSTVIDELIGGLIDRPDL